MEKKEQQKIIIWIITKIILITWLIFVIYYFIIPKYSLYNENINNINNINNEIKSINLSWFSLDSLKKVLSSNAVDKSIINLLSQKDKIVNIIKKPNNYTWDYLSWTSEEVLKEVDINKEIETNNKIIWDIIPTFLDYYDNPKNIDVTWDIKNKITIDNFIVYIEDQILKKYNLESYVSIWINDIVFEKNESNIWNFKINIDFSWKNIDIKNLLKHIYESWKITITKDWKLLQDKSITNNNWLSSNLLITIEDLSLGNLFDESSENNSLLNKWKMTLRFYVRWIGFDYFVKIKNKIQQECDALLKNINEKSSLCDTKNTNCNNEQFNKAVSVIKLLNSETSIIKDKLDEFNKKVTITNFNQEIDNLFKIYSSLQTIQSKFNLNNVIISNIKNSWAK